jgi:hypothetical protein
MSEALRIEQALDLAVLTTFESMLFLELHPLTPEPPSDEVLQRVDLATELPLKCAISLEASAETIEMLQEALFADSPPHGDMGFDVLAEILNVVAGNFLTELDDATPVSIGLPVAHEEKNSHRGAPGVQRVYELEQGPMRVRFSIA